MTLSQVVPLPVEPGPAPFDTYKYNMSVIGHYDRDRPVPGRRGEPAADHRALRVCSVTAANSNAAKALGDTSGSLLEAKFQVRTYVKSASAEGEASGT